MKNFYLLLFLLFTITTNAQRVTTYLDAPDAMVDDALVLDSQGNLYGSSFYGGTVTKVAPDGTVTPFVSGLIYANGLAVDSHDNVFVAAYAEGSINKYDSDGNLLQVFPVDGYPSGLIKAHRSDNMVYTEVASHSVIELSVEDGSVTVLYQGDPLSTPVGLAYNQRGDLYIGNYVSREIYKLTARRGQLRYVATVPSSDNDFPYLAFIAYANGSLYGTIYGEHKIYKIHPRRIDRVEIYAGSTSGNMDGNISEATFAYPSGLVFNRSGNTLYVSQFDGFGHIRKIKKGHRHGHGHHKAEEKAISIKVYPNPATDFIHIVEHSETKENKIFQIKLYRISDGKLVINQEKKSVNGSYSLPVLGLKKGFYELFVSSGKGIETKRIWIH